MRAFYPVAQFPVIVGKGGVLSRPIVPQWNNQRNFDITGLNLNQSMPVPPPQPNNKKPILAAFFAVDSVVTETRWTNVPFHPETGKAKNYIAEPYPFYHVTVHQIRFDWLDDSRAGGFLGFMDANFVPIFFGIAGAAVGLELGFNGLGAVATTTGSDTSGVFADLTSIADTTGNSVVADIGSGGAGLGDVLGSGASAGLNVLKGTAETLGSAATVKGTISNFMNPPHTPSAVSTSRPGSSGLGLLAILGAGAAALLLI